MDKLNFGDIVLLKFPFTDSNTFKKRPALIINDFNDGDLLFVELQAGFTKLHSIFTLTTGKIQD
jgi:hypothetical protein